ncbi:TBC1 domain family member 31 isoform X2 [Leptinotarsa decemlineata]|uniref:TBC1 domain family member 31 isoform X2 n=1 Tax=Leptinotarsa decemlineata TaxID=7539 RepID=UPI003D304B0F
MDLPVTLPINQGVTKKLFKLKPLRYDGLLLNIHHSTGSKKVRFVHICFHNTDPLIVSADNEGHFYIIDYSACKFWALPILDSCTFIKFSPLVQNELLIGRSNGDILLVNIDSGHVVGKLQGHELGVEYVSFAKHKYCLSKSQEEGIVWDLETNSKIQVLNLEKNNLLKFVSFIPVSSNILACFQDDLIQVWNFSKFETIKQFLPTNWKNYSVKSIAFTRNGQFMIIAGYLPTLAVFDLGSWKLTKMVTLPDYIHTLKHIGFVSQPFDGGSNKILIILSGQGIIYFYDVEQNVILSELSSKTEINKFACSADGTHLSCLLCSGEMKLYCIKQYVASPVEVKVQDIEKKMKSRRTRPLGDIVIVKQEIGSVLEWEKLKAILQEFNQYPDIHRLKIWEKLLELPNNIQQYNSIINHVTLVSFEDLYTKYPLESKLSIKDLRKLLNNLVTWCPFFANVDYLPVFAYPFAKVFQNKPLAGFEAICTVILNWCQHWFEYFPLPPVNILAMIENILLEHDPELLHHYASNNITSNIYVWPLLETAFSEVLTSSEWLHLWDHVLTNEISFLLCAAAAYNITQRHTLVALKKPEDFNFFFHNQNPNDMKKLLKTTYCLLNNTCQRLHPRQYMEKFRGLEKGNYPLFIEYPKTIIDFRSEKFKEIEGGLKSLADDETALLQKAREEDLEKVKAELRKEEKRREKEVEKKCFEQLKSKIDFLKYKQQDLARKKAELNWKETHSSSAPVNSLTNDSNEEFANGRLDEQEHSVKKHVELSKSKEKYLKQLKELLKYKYVIDKGFDQNASLSDNDTNIMKKKYQQQINTEIEKIRKSLGSLEDLKKLNITTSLEVIDKFIDSIEREIKPKESRSGKADVQSEVLKLLRFMKRNKNEFADESQNCSAGNKALTCFCETVCPKTVRFSISESSGS